MKDLSVQTNELSKKTVATETFVRLLKNSEFAKDYDNSANPQPTFAPIFTSTGEIDADKLGLTPTKKGRNKAGYYISRITNLVETYLDIPIP